MCWTRLRVVEQRTSSGRTGTDTCASRGRTWPNHPTTPARTKTAPTTDTARLVTKPSAPSVAPKARITGQAVGDGSWTTISPSPDLLSFDSFMSSPAQHIDNREYD